jgi:hypothetical protein
MTGEEIYEQFNNYILKSAYCFQKYFEQHTEEDLYQEYWTEIMENIDSINTVEDLKSVLIKTRSRLQREQNLRVYERSYGIVLNTEILNLPDPIYQLYGNREQQWYHEHLDEVHERQRKYYKKNKEKMHEYQKNYRKKRKTEMTEEEKEIERQKHRDYYEKNKEKYKQKRLEQKENGQSYYERNKEKIKAYQKEHSKTRDVEKDRARCREYYQAHKEELLKKKAEQYKERKCEV